MAVSTSYCMGAFPTQQQQQQQRRRRYHAFANFCTSPSILHSQRPGNYKGGRGAKARSVSVAVLPLYTLGTEIPGWEVMIYNDDWVPDEKLIKNIYLCFSLFFVWGCCVFGSMKDPFYDSDVYRDAGGDGSGNWIYKLEEEEEVQAREELWREELAREMEERVEELRELEEGQKEKELV